MPTYDYVCENCGHTFEQFQAISARPLTKCPDCGSRSLKRMIGSGSGIIFKGSGFYQTDYRTESYKNAEKSEKAAGDTSKSKAEPTTSTARDKKSPPPKEEKKSA